MLNAIVSAHWQNGVWATNGGYELPLLVAVSSLAIVATGPGVLSADAAMGVPQWGGLPAFLAAALGLVTGAIVLASRSLESAAADEAAAPEESQPSEQRRAA
jgi:putative oxidoreductase